VSDTPIIEARGLVVARDGSDIVHIDRFAVQEGEVHVVLGPNGAGKSTLLRALDGLEPMSGTLLYGGRPVRSERDRRQLRRATAVVFQKPYLLATTVLGNVESGLRLRGVGRDEARRRALAALDLLGVDQLADRRRKGLSGGEAQRVSIARALAGDPEVLFLDEPMAALDPPTRRGLLADLERIVAERAITVVWVTHDKEEALQVADRVTFLAKGRILQEGTAAEVLNRPATDEVADYLGVDVWLSGSVVDDPDAGSRFVADDGSSLACAGAYTGPAFACVHPEDVALSLSEPAPGSVSDRNVLPTTVVAIRPKGRLRLVELDWGSQPLQALVTQAAADHLALEVGMPVCALIKAVAVHIVPRAAPTP